MSVKMFSSHQVKRKIAFYYTATNTLYLKSHKVWPLGLIDLCQSLAQELREEKANNVCNYSDNLFNLTLYRKGFWAKEGSVKERA